uniref:Uncharacterized protein n=1 Tax=Ixodes ricinus TaxID=34613 RepID=A0A6B0V9D9_IXORI
MNEKRHHYRWLAACAAKNTAYATRFLFFLIFLFIESNSNIGLYTKWETVTPVFPAPGGPFFNAPSKDARRTRRQSGRVHQGQRAGQCLTLRSRTSLLAGPLHTVAKSRRSSARASAVDSCLAFTTVRLRVCNTWGSPRACCRSQSLAWAAGSSDSCSSPSASPSRSASSASTLRPDDSSSSAAEGPSRRTRRVVPPQPGTRPMRTWTNWIWALGSMSRKSQAVVSSAPPPRALPWTRQALSRGRSCRAVRASCMRADIWAPCSGESRARIMSRSPPEQNRSPSLSSSSALPRGQASSSATASCSATIISPEKELRLPGWLKTSSPMPEVSSLRRDTEPPRKPRNLVRVS